MFSYDAEHLLKCLFGTHVLNCIVTLMYSGSLIIITGFVDLSPTISSNDMLLEERIKTIKITRMSWFQTQFEVLPSQFAAKLHLKAMGFSFPSSVRWHKCCTYNITCHITCQLQRPICSIVIKTSFTICILLLLFSYPFWSIFDKWHKDLSTVAKSEGTRM